MKGRCKESDTTKRPHTHTHTHTQPLYRVSGALLTCYLQSATLHTARPFYRWENWGAESLSDWIRHHVASDGHKWADPGAHAKSPTRFTGAPVCSPQKGLEHFSERQVDTAFHVERTGRVRKSELLFHCWRFFWDIGSLNQPSCLHC